MCAGFHFFFFLTFQFTIRRLKFLNFELILVDMVYRDFSSPGFRGFGTFTFFIVSTSKTPCTHIRSLRTTNLTCLSAELKTSTAGHRASIWWRCSRLRWAHGVIEHTAAAEKRTSHFSCDVLLTVCFHATSVCVVCIWIYISRIITHERTRTHTTTQHSIVRLYASSGSCTNFYLTY